MEFDILFYNVSLIVQACTIVSSEKIQQEMVRDAPLDMQPYGMILGSHRQPNESVDKLLHTDEATHIIIMSNNHVSRIVQTFF